MIANTQKYVNNIIRKLSEFYISKPSCDQLTSFIQKMYNDFFDTVSFKCPVCSCSNFKTHDRRTRFLIIVVNKEKHKISIYIKRIKCQRCHKVFTILLPIMLPNKNYTLPVFLLIESYIKENYSFYKIVRILDYLPESSIKIFKDIIVSIRKKVANFFFDDFNLIDVITSAQVMQVNTLYSLFKRE